SSPAGAFMRNVCLLVMLALASVSTYSAESASKTDPRAVIAKKIPGVEIDDVRPSPIKGLYEVRIGGESVYATADGRYVISGDLYDIDAKVNLTEEGRSAERKTALAKIDEREAIVFSPASVKHTITVFTDVDCG